MADYKQLHPKVGDKFRVVKELTAGVMEKGEVESVRQGKTLTISRVPTIKKQTFGIEENPFWHKSKYLTTEYLEPVEEEKPFRRFSESHPEEFNKQPITTKIMNRIKTALLSKEDKTLIKAGYLNNNLDLTCEGKEALQFIQFTANKAELVKMAEEDIKESEDN